MSCTFDYMFILIIEEMYIDIKYHMSVYSHIYKKLMYSTSSCK